MDECIPCEDGWVKISSYDAVELRIVIVSEYRLAFDDDLTSEIASISEMVELLIVVAHEARLDCGSRIGLKSGGGRIIGIVLKSTVF